MSRLAAVSVLATSAHCMVPLQSGERGLSADAHTLEFEVVSGTLVVDAVAVVP